jgi:hypothetical protein
VQVRVLLAGPVALFAVVLLAACGGGDGSSADTTETTPATTSTRETAPSRSTELTRKEAADKYLEILGPANAALAKWQKQAQSYTDDTTAEEIGKDTAPVAAALDDASAALLRVQWPSSVAPDVKELVRAHGPLAGDFRSVSSQTIFSVQNWITQLQQDAGKAHAAANIVRSDLGLPPASG